MCGEVARMNAGVRGTERNPKLRVALLNTEDSRGGAARAAYRLHRALCATGVESTMLVQVKHSGDPTVSGPPTRLGNLVNALRPALDLAPVLLYPNRNRRAVFYPGWLPDAVLDTVRKVAPDLIHLHWITGGFINVRSLPRLARPLVWTLHDMWPLSGGCHYDLGCGRHATGCGRCPVLGSGNGFDLSRVGWKRKQRAYRSIDLTIVTPSRWLAEVARSSPLLGGFPIHVIPNGVDTDVYRPLARQTARELLRLPLGSKLILFGAAGGTNDPRKGFHYLSEALQLLARSGCADCAAVVFGASAPAVTPDFGMPVHFTGEVADDLTLATIYSAADVFVAPSTQENLSNTVVEALACGTPCVAFDVGGMVDLIVSGENGDLAKAGDSHSLAACIQRVLDGNTDRLREGARSSVLRRLAVTDVARRHAELYAEILKRQGPHSVLPGGAA
jgi:glycosyltransferase involved in cell wall biosynthesis